MVWPSPAFHLQSTVIGLRTGATGSDRVRSTSSVCGFCGQTHYIGPTSALARGESASSVLMNVFDLGHPRPCWGRSAPRAALPLALPVSGSCV
jgi:hypothetical protein